jgi:hypothetical protein
LYPNLGGNICLDFGGCILPSLDLSVEIGEGRKIVIPHLSTGAPGVWSNLLLFVTSRPGASLLRPRASGLGSDIARLLSKAFNPNISWHVKGYFITHPFKNDLVNSGPSFRETFPTGTRAEPELVKQ